MAEWPKLTGSGQRRFRIREEATPSGASESPRRRALRRFRVPEEAFLPFMPSTTFGYRSIPRASGRRPAHALPVRKMLDQFQFTVTGILPRKPIDADRTTVDDVRRIRKMHPLNPVELLTSIERSGVDDCQFHGRSGCGRQAYDPGADSSDSKRVGSDYDV